MAAGIYNFTIEQGTTFQRTFKYKNADGTPFDLTSGVSDIRMQLRTSIDANGFIMNADLGNGLITTSSSPTNEFTLTISDGTTSGFSFDSAVYDLELETTSSAGTQTTRLLQGKVKLSKEVTR